MKTFWTTFYSYKGGVGRSLALANIAALLVKRGRRIVLIDFDLEAPGLDSFEEFKCTAGKPGVVEYVTQYIQTHRAPDITQFLHPCGLPGPLRGKLWIMPAGKKDLRYNECRAELNLSWVELYEHHYGQQFIENWKAAIAHHCQPDYVLVDSRTGLTDVGGICTLHLPDLVVMVFGLNEQNIKGIAAVAKTIRESESASVPQMHYVVSPLPNLTREKRGPLTKRLLAAKAHLGVKLESILRYHSSAALSEKLFVLHDEFDSLPLVHDYSDLLKRIIEYNRNGLDFLSTQAKEAMDSVDKSRMQRLVGVLESEYPERAESLSLQSQLRLALGDPEVAKSLARKALEIDPAFETPFTWLLEQLQRERSRPEALSLCNTLLKAPVHMAPSRLNDLHSSRGEIAMAIGDYETARSSYQFCLDHAKQGEHIAPILLLRTFNHAEAARRCTRTPQPDLWKQAIVLFEESGEASYAPLTVQANNWQAMHIAYAMTGDPRRAQEALVKAAHAASRLGRAEDIFNVKTYTNVTVDDFVAINDEMLAALGRGQLWDGMPLPPPGAPGANQEPMPSEDSQPPDTDQPPPRRVGRKFDFEE